MADRIHDSRFGLGDEDWRVLATAGANILVIGPPAVTARVLDALRPTVGEPIAQWLPDEGTAPPCACATLILEGADRLTLDDQRRVDEWLASGAPPQVITTASEPLFPFVEQGRFLARLYYRLNVIYLALEPEV